MLYNHTGRNRKLHIQDGGHYTSNTYFSVCIQDCRLPEKLQLYLRFWGSGSSNGIRIVSMLYDQTRRNRKWNIQDSGLKLRIGKSQLVHKIATKRQPVFGSDHTSGIELLCDVSVSGNSQMAALTGNRFEIMCISACIHESNETSATTRVLLASCNSSAFWPNLTDETGIRESKMAATKTGNTYSSTARRGKSNLYAFKYTYNYLFF